MIEETGIIIISLNKINIWEYNFVYKIQIMTLRFLFSIQNYKHCFSYAIGKPGDLTQPYEIINKSNYNHLVWPLDHSGMYVFRVKILDPNYR